ncbi:rRNA maturation RNase YbeY [Rhodobacteraceae bacterium F11138]|nr:rRNA maturation RNase YbeY [Rhodobacteraceae bacterium F11138]
MLMETEIADSRWLAVDLPDLAQDAALAVLAARNLDAGRCEIALLACDDARIAELNHAFRGKPDPTNVLSWPSEDLAPATAGTDPAPPQPDFTGQIVLGDIAIAWDTCAREASEAGKPIHDHVTHLVVHGVLHLLGFDHVRDPDATVMQRLEVEILGRLGIDDPYRETGGA